MYPRIQTVREKDILDLTSIYKTEQIHRLTKNYISAVNNKITSFKILN